MDYLTFHLVFVLPVFGVLAAVYLRERLYADDPSPLGMLVVTVIAFVYTTPWDSYMISRGAWEYGDGRLLTSFWGVPVGEFLFFVVQPLITGTWLYLVLSRVGTRDAGSWAPRYALSAAGVAVTVIGWRWAQGAGTFYVGMILVWAGPVLVLQWAYGGHYVFRNARVVAAAVVPPTLYLAAVDRLAIEDGIWVLSDELTTGVTALGLPVEEGAFFLLTNLLSVQGIILFRWTLEEWRSWVDEYEVLGRLTRLSGHGPSA